MRCCKKNTPAHTAPNQLVFDSMHHSRYQTTAHPISSIRQTCKIWCGHQFAASQHGVTSMPPHHHSFGLHSEEAIVEDGGPWPAGCVLIALQSLQFDCSLALIPQHASCADASHAHGACTLVLTFNMSM